MVTQAHIENVSEFVSNDTLCVVDSEECASASSILSWKVFAALAMETAVTLRRMKVAYFANDSFVLVMVTPLNIEMADTICAKQIQGQIKKALYFIYIFYKLKEKSFIPEKFPTKLN